MQPIFHRLNNDTGVFVCNDPVKLCCRQLFKMCIRDRLKEMSRMNNKKQLNFQTIAVDFDGTLCYSK